VTDLDGEDMAVAGPDPVMVGKDLVQPKSRTFIPSSVDDNLFLSSTGYKATLQSLPEPLRSQMLHGNFMAGVDDPVWQTIPTEWIKAAMARWADRTTKGPMTALGFDVARGGVDKSTAARRHSNWFDSMVQIPGQLTKDGPAAAGFIAPLVRDRAPVCIDGIGIGGSAVDFCTGLGMTVVPVIGSEGSKSLAVNTRLRFKNRRAEMYWRVREALDPVNDTKIALPPDAELEADLRAVRYKVVQMGTEAGLLMRDKDEIRKLLGRSPDKGDAVAMTFVDGLPEANDSLYKRQRYDA
jgi:hypothetical protein